MHSRTAQRFRCLVAGIVLLGVAAGAHAQLASKVKDINTTVSRSLGSPIMSGFATLGSSTFFALDDGGSGTEVWKIDGATGSAALFKDICPGSCPSLPGSFITIGNLLLFRADDGVHGNELWKTDGTVGGTVMVRDIYPGRSPGIGGLFTYFDGFLYFVADDGIHGLEMWKSDGTAAGTALVADFYPGLSTSFTGPASSSPFIQASSQDKFLFTVSDPAYGVEPWISDGTAAGTHRIRDLNPGPGGSMIATQPFDGNEPALALPDGTFLFAANDGVHGEELWRTDGTDAGTVLVKDINPGASDSDPTSFELLNGKVYFVATHQDTGEELWVTDGTAAGTVLVKDLVAGTGSIFPERLTAANGRLFFRGTFQGFWTSDGTAGGTVLLTSNPMLALGKLGDSVLALTSPLSFGSLLLWKTDGTPGGTVSIKNLGPPDSRCFFNQPDMRQIGGEVFFYRCLRGSGLELWKSDGTPEGTVLVESPTRTPSFPGAYQFTTDPGFLAALGNGLFFSANDGVAGPQLWYTDGSPGSTQPVPGLPSSSNLWPSSGISRPIPLGNDLLYPHSNGLFRLDGSGASSESLVTAQSSFSSSPAGNLLFFLSNTPANGQELWKSDGTVAGTGIVKDITPGSASTSLQLLRPLGSQFLFKVNGDVLWRSDGTEAGTLLLRDFLPGSSAEIRHTAALGNTFFVIALDENRISTLWKTDGTPAGTLRVKTFDQGPSVFGATISGILPVGNRIHLVVNDGIHGDEIWVSDGTEAGTHLLKDVRPGAGSSLTSFFDWWTVPGQSLLYFIADDGTHGQEIWVSDGTVAGTRLLKDIWPGAGSPFIEPVSSPGQSLFWFTAEDGAHGRELWVSDGTEAGTRMLKDIRPGAGSSGAGLSLATVQSRLFFTADDGVHGTELWVSDGTEAGTRLVQDTLPGPESSLPSNLFSVGRTLVFNASDGVHGVEPWVTSGTETGTFMLQDIAPGAQSSSPWLYTSVPPHVYFLAVDDAGSELWKTSKAALEPTFDDVHSTYWAWPYVEALAANGLTTGCGGGLYCPTRTVSRAEMAVFVLRVAHGNTYVPPDVPQSRFADVPASYWATDWIEQLAVEGITSGCGVSPPLYCPESPTSRDQMAVFLLRALHGADYTPPPATGTVFTDVPAGYWAAAWIEQLAAEGITTGCAANLYCPGDPVSREQMAVFLTRALDLPLP